MLRLPVRHAWTKMPQISARAMPTLSATEAEDMENSRREGSTSLASSVKAFTYTAPPSSPACQRHQEKPTHCPLPGTGSTSCSGSKVEMPSNTRHTGHPHQQQQADHVHCICPCYCSGLQALLCLLLLPRGLPTYCKGFTRGVWLFKSCTSQSVASYT